MGILLDDRNRRGGLARIRCGCDGGRWGRSGFDRGLLIVFFLPSHSYLAYLYPGRISDYAFLSQNHLFAVEYELMKSDFASVVILWSASASENEIVGARIE
jgi:hypothetical protein